MVMEEGEESKGHTGTGKLTDEKEKLVGSLMFLKNGHLSIPCWTTVSSKQLGSLRALRKAESIWRPPVTRPASAELLREQFEQRDYMS